MTSTQQQAGLVTLKLYQQSLVYMDVSFHRMVRFYMVVVIKDYFYNGIYVRVLYLKYKQVEQRKLPLRCFLAAKHQ